MRAVVLRLPIAALVLAAAISSAAAQAPEVSDDSFPAEVIETSRHEPVFVNFIAAWCGPCRLLFPTLDAVAPDYKGRAKLVSIDIDNSAKATSQVSDALQAKDLTMVSQIPALVVYRDGEPADILVGNAKEEKVREFFERNAGEGGQ